MLTMKIKIFPFNQFLENTIVLSDSTNECIIIDPGCYNNEEKQILENYIITNNLKPVKLINTHCHIDHILGNNFVSSNWDIDLEINKNDLNLLNESNQIAKIYGFVNYENSPNPKIFLTLKTNIESDPNFIIPELFIRKFEIFKLMENDEKISFDEYLKYNPFKNTISVSSDLNQIFSEEENVAYISEGSEYSESSNDDNNTSDDESPVQIADN